MTVRRIWSVPEYQLRLADVIQRMRDLTAKHPGFPDWEAILIQLEDLQKWTKDGTKPTEEQRESLIFGFLAYRSVNGFDDDLGDELIAVSDYVKRKWQ